jgi:hypothetical protein
VHSTTHPDKAGLAVRGPTHTDQIGPIRCPKWVGPLGCPYHLNTELAKLVKKKFCFRVRRNRAVLPDLPSYLMSECEARCATKPVSIAAYILAPVSRSPVTGHHRHSSHYALGSRAGMGIGCRKCPHGRRWMLLLILIKLLPPFISTGRRSRVTSLHSRSLSEALHCHYALGSRAGMGISCRKCPHGRRWMLLLIRIKLLPLFISTGMMTDYRLNLGFLAESAASYRDKPRIVSYGS